MENRFIFHVDVNSAFLSWSASDRIKNGDTLDLRNVPSVVGGDEKSRHGIVLAKSVPAKKYGIVTGESLYSARKKCPEVIIIPPCFRVYKSCSSLLVSLLKEYTPAVEQYSIDECFMDVTYDMFDEPYKMACSIKDRIKSELGFTVSIGVSHNKLLAKMASDLKKPDAVSTIYPSEIQKKMWPLPVEELFMVGKRAKEKLNGMYIFTIGELAQYDMKVLKSKFKSYGELIWKYANGIDESPVRSSDSELKAISSSNTFSKDITLREEAVREIFLLCENVSARLRKIHKYCGSLSVAIKSSDFRYYSHQKKFGYPTQSTKKVMLLAEELFDEMWKKEPIRLLGVSVSQLHDESIRQISVFDDNSEEKENALDRAIDLIRCNYGDDSIKRACLMKKKK